MTGIEIEMGGKINKFDHSTLEIVDTLQNIFS